MFTYTHTANDTALFGKKYFGIWTDGVSVTSRCDKKLVTKGKEYKISIMLDMDDVPGSFEDFEYPPLKKGEIAFCGIAKKEENELGHMEFVAESKTGFQLRAEISTSGSFPVAYQLQEGQGYRVLVSEVIDLSDTEISRKDFDDALKAVLKPKVFQTLDIAFRPGDVQARLDLVANQMLLGELEDCEGSVHVLRAVAKRFSETGMHGLIS